MTSAVPVILLVTPSFNSDRYLEETILSVVSQHGDFRIRYHVQDGGSSDGTLAILERWAASLGAGSFPALCAGVEFTYQSESDSGMYDAINRGFERLKPTGDEYMTYINSDDILLPGALQVASDVFRDSPEIAWMGGRPCEMNEQGEVMRVHDEQVFPVASLRAGLHDGRSMCFVMQEGTFWRAEMWRQSGGFRTDLRLAGDWDLWRRFAAWAPYFPTDTPLAAHRRHEAQLTADADLYFREIDQVVAREVADLHQTELARYRAWAGPSEEDRDPRFYGPILRFQRSFRRGGKGEWKAEERPYVAPLKTSVAVTNGFTRAMLPAEFVDGFGPECTGSGGLNLVNGFRVTESSTCVLRIRAHHHGLHRIFLRCRCYDPGVRLKLVSGTRVVLDAELVKTNLDRDCLVIAEAVFEVGPNTVTMTISGTNPGKTPVLVVISCEAMSTI